MNADNDTPNQAPNQDGPGAETPTVEVRVSGAARLGLGLVQGLALWGLHEAGEAKVWPATTPEVFFPLVLVCLFAPLIVIQGLGRIGTRTLAIWTLAAAVLLALLGLHDALRAPPPEVGQSGPDFNPALIPLSVVGLFIGHALVAAADHDGRWIGRYPSHFELAWKHGVQIALSGLFVGVFWALLWLGAALFEVIGIKAFRTLLEQSWFYVPASFMALAAAIHLTDVRVGLIRGVRTVALTMLSWLTPMMALIAAGFLVALPFTGLGPLFETRAATAILLAAAAVLIVLVNTIYQDGDADGSGAPNVVLRWSARIGSVALVPIVAIAGYALMLRIGQYGLTPERVIAAAFVLNGAIYAAGYAFAAVKPGGFMKPLELTNVAGAYVAIACLLALLSPIADPAKLSVNDQLARLASGAVTPDKFDYRFLRYDAAKYGRDALKRLQRHASPVVRERATEALTQEYRNRPPEPATDRPPVRVRAADLKVVTPGKALPAAFLAQDWVDDPALGDCGDRNGSNQDCRAVIADFDRDGVDDILVVRAYQSGLYRLVEGKWRRTASLRNPCSGWAKALDEGKGSVAEPGLRDLVIDGRPLTLSPEPDVCDPGFSLFGQIR